MTASVRKRSGTGRVRRRAVAAAVVVGLGAVLPALVTALGGGFGLTRNDDYAFLATMRVFVEHGTFQLRGPADMTLIGQILLAWPVAKVTSSSTTALELTTLAVGTIGLGALAVLARQVLDLKRSVIVAVAITATPLWAPLATTFMTDVWALGLAAVACALAVRAVGSATTAAFGIRLGMALAAAGAAFLVRQTAAGALVAVAAGTVVGLATVRADRPNARTERLVAGALTAVVAAGCLAGYHWRSSMPLGGVVASPWELDRLILPFTNGDRALVSLAMLLLPVSVAFVRRGQVRRRAQARPRLALVTGVAIAWVVVLKLIARPLDELTLYDYATQFGASSDSAPMAAVAIVPSVLWAAFVVVAAFNLWVLVLVISGPGLRRCWQQRPVVFAVTAAMALVSAVLFVVGWIISFHVFDRYLLTVVPFAGLLIAWISVLDDPADEEAVAAGRRPAPLVLGPVRSAALVSLVVVGAWFGLASASFDRAVHRAGERAVARSGLDPAEIDAGMTVNGTRASEAPLGEPLVPFASVRCWRVHQSEDRSGAHGPLLEHQRLLWVDRWFYLAHEPGACKAPPGG